MRSNLALLVALLSGCSVLRPEKPLPAAVPLPATFSVPDSSLTSTVDSVVVVPRRTVLQRVLGQHVTSQRSTYHTSAGIMPQVGKKSTVSIYYGPAVITTNTAAKNAAAGAGATSAAKAAGPVAGAAAVAQDFTKQGQRGGAAASGAQATATATTTKGFPWWLLLIPVVGYVAYQVKKRFTIF